MEEEKPGYLCEEQFALGSLADEGVRATKYDAILTAMIVVNMFVSSRMIGNLM